MLKLFYSEGIVEAGCDEAGRGCLAGPVFAAAVVFSSALKKEHIQELKLLNDSKKLNASVRYSLRDSIENIALSFAVAKVDPHEIDEINILNASFLAMHRALDNLTTQPDNLLIDGNRFKPYQNIPHQCIIGGDGKYFTIAAASILAKTYRDDYMKALDVNYPVYNWKNNKGYPTRNHRDAIAMKGISPHHRRSFKLLAHQLRLPFEN